MPIGRDPLLRGRVQEMRAAASAWRDVYDSPGGGAAGNPVEAPIPSSGQDTAATTEGADVQMRYGDDAAMGPVPQGDPVVHGPSGMDTGSVCDAGSRARSTRCNFSNRNRKRYDDKELSWQYVGSGTYRRVFMNARKMMMTTKTGPTACDVVTRTVRCAITGKLLDTCQVQDTPD